MASVEDADEEGEKRRSKERSRTEKGARIVAEAEGEDGFWF